MLKGIIIFLTVVLLSLPTPLLASASPLPQLHGMAWPMAVVPMRSLPAASALAQAGAPLWQQMTYSRLAVFSLPKLIQHSAAIAPFPLGWIETTVERTRQLLWMLTRQLQYLGQKRALAHLEGGLLLNRQ